MRGRAGAKATGTGSAVQKPMDKYPDKSLLICPCVCPRKGPLPNRRTNSRGFGSVFVHDADSRSARRRRPKSTTQKAPTTRRGGLWKVVKSNPLSQKVNESQYVAYGREYDHDVPYHVGELELLTGVEEQAYYICCGSGDDEPEGSRRSGKVQGL